MRQAILFCALAVCAAVPLSAQSSLDTRLATQNALFEEIYQTVLRNNPQHATAVGDYRYNDRLGDYTVAHLAAVSEEQKRFLARLTAIDTTGFSDQDQLSHTLMERGLRQQIEDYGLKNWEMSVNQQNGIHTGLADLPNAVPLDTVKHYDDYIARLHQIPRVLRENEDLLRLGIRDQLTEPGYIAEKVAVQANDVARSKPFLRVIAKMPASFSDADRQRITHEIQQAVDTEVSPAYVQFAAFMSKEYAPHGRVKIGVDSLPDGKHRYEVAVREMTTTNMTPAEIHQLGLDEIKRIRAEMTDVARRAGYKDLVSFQEALRKDPKFIPTSSEQIVEVVRHFIDGMRPKLPELFTVLPVCPVTVEAIPSYQTGASTHYQTGTPNCSRPGRVSVATSDFEHRTLIDDEALAYHEGIPGHHMQRSIQQQLKGLPKFRLHGEDGLSVNAYTEGWGLYAEELGKSIGFYQEPGYDYGRLSSELFRAVRLVVDTGIHSQGWTRDQVIQFFRENSNEDEPNIQAETDRYIAWPGQCLSYKIGQLKFRELRTRAQKELGPKFDLRTFHDEVLSSGAIPLDLLDARTNAWIAGQKAGAKLAAASAAAPMMAQSDLTSPPPFRPGRLWPDTSGTPIVPLAGTNGGKAPLESAASRCTVSSDEETITAVPATIIIRVTRSSDGANRLRLLGMAGAADASAG